MSNSPFQEMSSTAMVPLVSRDNVHLIRSWTLARSRQAGPNLTPQSANAVGGRRLTLTQRMNMSVQVAALDADLNCDTDGYGPESRPAV